MTVTPTPPPPFELVAEIGRPAVPNPFVIPPRWSPDGTRLAVERIADPRPWPWLDDHQVDLGAVACILGLALAGWWIVRTLRRPRVVGRRYCPHCNYDVTAPSADRPEPATCTECGRPLRRGTARGRPLWSRLSAGAVPAVALALAGFVTWSNDIAGQPSAGATAWPFAVGTTWTASWPFWRAPPFREFENYLDIFDVTDGGPVRLVRTIRLGGSRDWDWTSDGRSLAWAEQSRPTDWQLVVRWADVDTGTEGHAVIGTADQGFIRISGFTPDERAVVIARAGPVRGSPSTPTVSIPLTIHTVDLDLGTVRDVATSTITATNAGGGGWSVPNFGAAVGTGPQVSWVAVAFDQRASLLQDVTVGSAEGSRPLVLTSPATAARTLRLASLRIVDDRELWFRTSHAVDLETGAIRMLPAPNVPSPPLPWPIVVSPDGTQAAAVEITPDAYELDEALRLRVWRIRSR